MPGPEDLLNNPISYIFGGNTGVPTYEELKRRRAMAVANAAQGHRGYPKTLGEGLTALGEGVGQRLESNRLNEAERSLDEQNKRAVWAVQNPGVPYPGTGADASDPNAVKNRIAGYLTPGGPGGAAANPTEAAGASSPQDIPQATGGLPAEYNAAIGGIESGGRRDPYQTLGAVTPRGDRAYGKYQVMGANIPEWTQAALGQRMTPQQFLADRDAQEGVFKHRFGDYVSRYGPEGAARAWYAGEKGMKNLNATDMHGRLTVGGYGQDFMRRLQGARGAPSGAPVGTDDASETVTHIPGTDDENPPTPTTIRPAPAAVSGAPDIKPAPAAVSGRPAATMAPAYEMPKPERAVAPRPMPMDPREIALRRSLPLMHPESPQFRATQQIISEYDQRRAHHDAREIERSKAEDTLYNTLYPKWEEFQASKEKRALELQELRQKVETGKEIKLGQKDRLIKMDKDGVYRDMTPSRPGAGEGKPDVELTESQSKTFDNLQKADVAMEHYKRIPEADKVLAEGLQNELAGKVPFFGNALLQTRYRRARNAALNVAAAHLREISGAAIPVAEEAKTIAQLFPVYGDDPTLTKQKGKILNAVVTGMALKLGSAADPLITYARKERGKDEAVEQQKMRDEMAGVGVPEVGKIYVNKDKSGKVISRRFWTGSRWEDD